MKDSLKVIYPWCSEPYLAKVKKPIHRGEINLKPGSEICVCLRPPVLNEYGKMTWIPGFTGYDYISSKKGMTVTKRYIIYPEEIDVILANDESTEVIMSGEDFAAQIA